MHIPKPDQACSPLFSFAIVRTAQGMLECHVVDGRTQEFADKLVAELDNGTSLVLFIPCEWSQVDDGMKALVAAVMGILPDYNGDRPFTDAILRAYEAGLKAAR